MGRCTFLSLFTLMLSQQPCPVHSKPGVWDIKVIFFSSGIFLPLLLIWQNGATYCTSELAVLKNNEIHTWDRGFDNDGNQVSSHAFAYCYQNYA